MMMNKAGKKLTLVLAAGALLLFNYAYKLSAVRDWLFKQSK